MEYIICVPLTIGSVKPSMGPYYGHGCPSLDIYDQDPDSLYGDVDEFDDTFREVESA
jgi:hypothetical protein